MDLEHATFPSWLIEELTPLNPMISTRNKLDRYLLLGCEFMSKPEFIITKCLTKKPKEWDAHRKQLILNKARFLAAQCINLHADITDPEVSVQEAQLVKTLLLGYAEVYARWITNHPNVKNLWTELTKKCCILA